MKRLALFLMAVSLLAACRNENKEQTAANTKVDTLSYSYDSVKVYSKNVIKNADGIDSTKARIKYPIFKNEALNTYINRQVLNYFSEEDPSVTTYQEVVNSFVKGYDSFYAENSKDRPQSWFLLIDVKVLEQKPNYIALQRMHSDYAGGAHGITTISYLNFNPTSNQPITIDSLFDASQKPKLLSIAEGIFRKNEKLSATEPLTDKYFFDKGIFALAQNFYVKDKELVFLYNPYEIKAYAYGTTQLVIPFAAIKDIAKPNTILTATN